jgi:hypothetical protein
VFCFNVPVLYAVIQYNLEVGDVFEKPCYFKLHFIETMEAVESPETSVRIYEVIHNVTPKEQTIFIFTVLKSSKLAREYKSHRVFHLTFQKA